jgi:hypothetical protein
MNQNENVDHYENCMHGADAILSIFYFYMKNIKICIKTGKAAATKKKK